MIIVQLVSNPGIGGLERVVEFLASGMAARGHRVHAGLFCDARAPRPPLADALQGAGVAVDLWAMPPRSYLRERGRAEALCRKVEADLLHTHGYRADVLDAPAARRCGIPCVSTVHGFAGGDLKNRLYERFQMRALRRFDAVVAVSQRLAEGLAGRGVPASRLHTIVNAWRPGRPPLGRADARRALGVNVEGRRIGFVGRLSREKGADVLVEAVALLHEPEVAVSVLGDGRERSALEALAATRGLASRITWHGVVPDAARLTQAFDVLVLSSRTEGTPVALFEAMAASVPVVATRVGGVPAVVGEKEALLVPSEQPEALAQAIARVLHEPGAAAERAGAARRRLDEQFGEGPWLDAYEALYRNVVAERRQTPG